MLLRVERNKVTKSAIIKIAILLKIALNFQKNSFYHGNFHANDRL